MKKIIVVTGGAGFVGSNLIEILLKKTNLKIISIDNYSSGYKTNHIQNHRVKYLNSDTLEIEKKLRAYKNKINAIFHFGEFSRIYQSFKKLDQCLKSNVQGTQAVFKFCLENNIKLIYSATSATIGNEGKDKNLSPYAFTKAKNLEFLENLKKWFKLKFEVIYFYNVYGPRQICRGDMATVVGIFEDHYLNKKKIPVVRPGTQTRRFTHIIDTVEVCYEAWRKNKNKHYYISGKKDYSVIELARMFNKKIKYLPKRPGERYKSFVQNKSINKNFLFRSGKIQLKDYVINFLKKN